MNNIYSILPDYYKHRIAIVGKWRYSVAFRDALVECIKQYGFESQGFSEFEEINGFNPSCVVVIAPHLYEIPKNHDIIWIMIQTEQLFNDDKKTEQTMFSGYLKQLKPRIKAYDIILDGNKCNLYGLKRLTKSIVEYFPSYWFSEVDYSTKADNSRNKYDLLFIGNMPGMRNRREVLLSFLNKKYSIYPETTELWNEKKQKAILESRICLNIHYDESRYYESARMNDYFANHAFVLSEPMKYTEPYVEGEDYVEFFWTNICEKIDYYLEHEEERLKIADNAYKKLHEHSLMESTKILIDVLILESYNRYQVQETKNQNTIIRRIKHMLKKILRLDMDKSYLKSK